MSQVMLLGAGASYASTFGLPTMASFFEDERLPPALRGFLDDFYWTSPGRDETEEDVIARNRTRYNLEEVLTHLHLTELREERWTGKRRGYPFGQQYSYKQLLEYVPGRLETSTGKLCRVHESLFMRLEPRDSVITLNYDLIADNVLHFAHPRLKAEDAGATHSRVEKLWHLIGSPFVVPHAATSIFASWKPYVEGYYLKLHGSIDWMRCGDGQCQNHAGYRPHGPAVPTKHVPMAPTISAWSPLSAAPCPVCGSHATPFLVPPIPSKTTEISARIQLMWTTALRELKAADRVTVIGVSFAPSDVDLRWLLRTAATSRTGSPIVEVVNPCAESRSRCLELFGSTWIRKEYETLESYLNGVTVDG